MKTELLIGGVWRRGSGLDTITVVDPATEEHLATVAAGANDDVVAACDAAESAQVRWAATSPRGRSEVLRSCWEILLEHVDELAELIVAEQGKPLVDARGEVSYAAEFFRWNAEECVRIAGSLGLSPSGDKRIIVRHPPVGVVVVVTPWNFPAAMITRKVAPALAAGNAVVVKPPKETPLTALRVADLLQQAGVPDGVINVVPATSASEWFDTAVAHRATRMVSFTGSTEVGRVLLRRCADRVLKTVMELGGNAPFIVFGDADIEAAVEGAMVAKMRHSAQTCTAANRFYVHSSVADRFAAQLAEAMVGLEVGNGMRPEVTCGPMINGEAIESIDSLVSAAVAAGADTLLGGRAIDGPGFFYAPTVLANVEAASPIVEAEIFGPVAPIVAFSDTDRMIEHANDTEMGLAAYVYTEDLANGLRVAERLHSGMVGLNRGAISDPAAPFGGMKQSGLGREGATEGIYEFCETQYISASW